MSGRRLAAAALLMSTVVPGAVACSENGADEGTVVDISEVGPEVAKLRIEVQQLRQEVQRLRDELAAQSSTTTTTTTPLR